MGNKSQNFKLAVARLRHHVNLNASALIGAALIIGTYLFVYSDVINKTFLIVWGAISFSSLAVRFWLGQKALNQLDHIETIEEIETLENRFLIGVAASGILWGVAGLAIGPSHIINHLEFFAVIALGLVTGASTAYATSQKAVKLFIAPTVLPLFVLLLQVGTKESLSLAVLVAFFSLFILKVSKQICDFILDSHRLKEQDRETIAELTSRQSAIAKSARLAALGEFATNMAHEINSPLTVAKGNTERVLSMLERSEDPTILKKTAGKALVGLNRMTEIISALSAYSRDNKRIEYDQASAKVLAEETVMIAKESLGVRDVEIRLNIEGNSPFLVDCYNVQIKQILFNLIRNAVDAVEDLDKSSRWVELNLSETDKSIVLSVTDGGNGIPQAIQSEMFLPFFSTKDDSKGVGLGLAIVKGLVDQHKGEIYVDNTSINTKIVVVLPRSKKGLMAA